MAQMKLIALLAITLLLSCHLQARIIERHPLELKAINDPKTVLDELPAAMNVAARYRDQKTMALLELARANACRVLADWACQQQAGIAAELAAERAGDVHLMVRAKVAHSRASSALQDYSRAEKSLAEAEQILKKNPHPDLMADVMLAYSSVSYQLGRLQASLEYTEKGEILFNAATDAASDTGLHIRLLRNRARAQISLSNEYAAKTALAQARALDVGVNDLKLSAEIQLETARLARKLNDTALQAESSAAVIAFASELKNSQLYGQALEVRGLAELDRKELKAAQATLKQSYDDLSKLNLRRDALRVLRELLPLSLLLKIDADQTSKLTSELIELQRFIDREDKALAASNFDSRMLYAEQEFEVIRLNESNLALQARQALAKRNEQLATAIAALCGTLLILMLIAAKMQSRSRQKLETSERRLRTVADHMPAEIAQLDTSQRYVFANAELIEQLRMQPNEVIGKELSGIRTPEEYARIESYVRQVLTGQKVRFEDHSIRDGETKFLETVFVPDFDSNRSVKGFFVLRFDITRLKLAERELAVLAASDSLTGLANRRTFDDRLELAIAHAKANRSAITILAIDIDHFKAINDSYGHLVGDAVIKRAAQNIAVCLRQSDLVARTGGDEFLILIEQSPSSQIGVHLAEKILLSVREPVLIDGHKIQIKMSIGVALTLQPDGAAHAIAPADMALYAAKNAGRNCFRLYNPLSNDAKVVPIRA